MSAFSGPRPSNAFTTPTKLQGVQQVKDHIQLAIDKAYSSHPTVYKEVTALLTHFKHDDLGVQDIENDLALTFRSFYGFRVQQILLDEDGGKPPRKFMFEKFLELSTRGLLNKNCLVIMVFSGHGEIKVAQTSVAAPTRVLHVGGSVDSTGALQGYTLPWRSTIDWLEDYEADVVQILDCCFAAEAASPSFEMLAATSGTEIAASSLETCFTQGLITELKRHSSSPVSISQLQKAMMDNRRTLRLEHTPTYEPRPGALPSILLTPKVGNMPRPNTIISGKANSTRALITAHLSEDLTMEDVEELERWLLSRVPVAVKKIDFQLEGYHKCGSTLLTISMPVELWSQLPADSAYTFVAFVDSTNLLLGRPTNTTQHARMATGLSIRGAGSENRVPGEPSQSGLSK